MSNKFYIFWIQAIPVRGPNDIQNLWRSIHSYHLLPRTIFAIQHVLNYIIFISDLYIHVSLFFLCLCTQEENQFMCSINVFPYHAPEMQAELRECPKLSQWQKPGSPPRPLAVAEVTLGYKLKYELLLHIQKCRTLNIFHNSFETHWIEYKKITRKGFIHSLEHLNEPRIWLWNNEMTFNWFKLYISELINLREIFKNENK